MTEEEKSYSNVLATGEVYHVFSKSIAEFKIFKKKSDFSRIKNLFTYYEVEKPSKRFSYFLRLKHAERKDLAEKSSKNSSPDKKRIVDVIAYCIMPTHIHLILKQRKERGISIFMKNVLNSYTRYFNTKYKRKGPLWEGRFKRVWVGTDRQLLHLTRYIHLNPVTAYLVDKPEEWLDSSFNEYIKPGADTRVCRYDEVLSITPGSYEKFVKERISYQKQLAKIKNLVFDNKNP